MKLCVFETDSAWEGFRSAVPRDDPEYIVVGVEPQRFEEEMCRKRAGKYIFLTDPNDNIYSPVAGVGLMVRQKILKIFLHYVDIFYLFSEAHEEVYSELYYEIRKYGERYNYEYVEFPFSNTACITVNKKLYYLSSKGVPDPNGRPFNWYMLERDDFDELDTICELFNKR